MNFCAKCGSEIKSTITLRPGSTRIAKETRSCPKCRTKETPKWFVHGHCDKDDDIAYVVEATGPMNAACQVAVEMSREVIEYPSHPPHRVYLVLPGMNASDLADELKNNMGSPRRSYEVSVTPFQMNENLM